MPEAIKNPPLPEAIVIPNTAGAVLLGFTHDGETLRLYRLSIVAWYLADLTRLPLCSQLLADTNYCIEEHDAAGARWVFPGDTICPSLGAAAQHALETFFPSTPLKLELPRGVA